MKTISHRTSSERTDGQLVDVAAPTGRRRLGGFTLVEMLVVITIIGILVALVVPAALSARRRVKIAAVVMEVKQLEMACQAYKEKFGEYPPDFSGINDPTAAVQAAARAVVTRHISKVFPRYAGDWTTDIPTVLSAALTPTTVTLTDLTPQMALTFWLGGIPDPAANFVMSGFAADPTNPFQLVSACASRVGPFYEFDRSRLYPTTTKNLMYWPLGVTNRNANNSYVYFRAENGNYTFDGAPSSTTSKNKGVVLTALVAGQTPAVVPAADWRISKVDPYTWINPQSFQILSCGLDETFATVWTTTQPLPPLQFPTGVNYRPENYDDITNFSNGTLEDAMK